MFPKIVVSDPLLFVIFTTVSMRDLHLRQNQIRCGIDRPFHMFIFDSCSIVEVLLHIYDLDELSIFRQSIRGSANMIFLHY